MIYQRQKISQIHHGSYKDAVLPEKKQNYMTVPAAIRELEKIEMTRQTDNVYRLDHAVTAKQKKILKAFGMNEGNITYRAGEISNTLKKSNIQKERR